VHAIDATTDWILVSLKICKPVNARAEELAGPFGEYEDASGRDPLVTISSSGGGGAVPDLSMAPPRCRAPLRSNARAPSRSPAAAGPARRGGGRGIRDRFYDIEFILRCPGRTWTRSRACRGIPKTSKTYCARQFSRELAGCANEDRRGSRRRPHRLQPVPSRTRGCPAGSGCATGAPATMRPLVASGRRSDRNEHPGGRLRSQNDLCPLLETRPRARIR